MSYLTILLLICLGVLIIISGFLSGSETALTATSKPRIFSKFKKGNKRAKYLLKILDNLENVISALLLSNNLVNILASSLATAVLYDLFGVSGIFYATMIMTIVSLYLQKSFQNLFFANQIELFTNCTDHFLS